MIVAVGREVDGDFRNLNEKNLENPPLWNGRKLAQLPAEAQNQLQINNVLANIAQNDGRKLVDVLMKYKDGPSDPALMQALHADDYQAAVMLIEYGVDLERRAPSKEIFGKIVPGETALEFAIRMKDTELVELLLNRKANPFNVRLRSKFHSDGVHKYNISLEETAIFDSINLGNLDAIILFHKCGFDLNKVCYSSITPWVATRFTVIQYALNQGKSNIAEFLLSVGVKL